MLIGVQSDEYIKKNCWEKTAPVDFRKKIGKPIRIPASGNFRRDFTFYQPPPSSLINLATNIVAITPKQNKPANANLVEQVVEGLMKHEEDEPPPPMAPPPQPPQGDDAPDLYGNAPAHPVEPHPIYPVNRGRPVNPNLAFPAGGYPPPPDTYREGALEEPPPDLYGSAPARQAEPPPIYPVNRGRPVNPLYAFPAGGYPAPPDTYRDGALEAPASQQAQRLAEAVQRGRPGQLALTYSEVVKKEEPVGASPLQMSYNRAYERPSPIGDRYRMAMLRTMNQESMSPYLPETGKGIYTTSRGGMRGGMSSPQIPPDYPGMPVPERQSGAIGHFPRSVQAALRRGEALSAPSPSTSGTIYTTSRGGMRGGISAIPNYLAPNVAMRVAMLSDYPNA